MIFYEIHVKYSEIDGFSVFFKDELPTDNIVQRAIELNLFDKEDKTFVDYAVTISEDEYNRATST